MLKLLTKQNIWNTWKVGAVVLIGWIAFSPDTLYLSTIGSTWFIIGWILGLLTISLYEVEIHAAETYKKFLWDNPESEVTKKIEEICQDEINHSKELLHAIELIDI